MPVLYPQKSGGITIAIIGCITISSVMALSSDSKDLPRQKTVVRTTIDQMLVDTVPGNPGKHKKSDTTSYPKRDTSSIR